MSIICRLMKCSALETQVKQLEQQNQHLTKCNAELLVLLHDWRDSFVDCLEGGAADELVVFTDAAINKAIKGKS